MYIRHLRLLAWPICRQDPVPGGGAGGTGGAGGGGDAAAVAKAAADAEAKRKTDADAAEAERKRKANGSGGGGGGDRTLNLTQTELDDIIETRLAKERLLIEKRLGTNPKDAEELERLRKEEVDRKRAAEEAKGNYEAALTSIRTEHEGKSKAWETERETLMREIREDRCRGRLVQELAAQNAVDAEDLAEVLLKRVNLDEQRQVVVLDAATGKPAFVNGVKVTIKDLVTKFKADKPWAFKADNAGEGAGSQGGASGADGAGDTTGLDAQIKAAKAELDLARKQAQASGTMGDMDKSRAAARKLHELEQKKKGKAA